MAASFRLKPAQIGPMPGKAAEIGENPLSPMRTFSALRQGFRHFRRDRALDFRN
jgi:hypothetical protein